MKNKATSTVLSLVLSVALIASSLSLSACAAPIPGIFSVVFVVQNNMNSAAINTAPLEEYAQRACESNGYVDIVYVSGSPTSVEGGGSRVGSTSDFPDRRASENKDWVAGIMNLITSGRPSCEEVDILASIQKASDSLAQAPAGEKAIVVVGSCISTSGYLSFVEDGAIGADPQEYVAYLDSNKAIPKGLEGIPIHFYFIGAAADEQKNPTPGQKENLINIYQAIMVEAGANPHFENAVAGSESRYDDLPYVTPIDFPDDPAMSFDLPTPQEPTVIELSNDALRFIGDLPDFDDYLVDHKATLDPFVELMRENPSMKLHITGCTATAGEDKGFVLWLSGERADAVKQYFVDRGIDSSRITTEGAGDTLASPDRNSDGSYIPAAAANNRKVIMEFLTVE